METHCSGSTKILVETIIKSPGSQKNTHTRIIKQTIQNSCMFNLRVNISFSHLIQPRDLCVFINDKIQPP